MRKFTEKQRKLLEALMPHDDYVHYQITLTALSEQLKEKSFTPVSRLITLSGNLGWFNQDHPNFKDIPVGKVGTIETAGVLPVIAMDVIDYFGNPLKTDLKELAEIVEEFSYRAYKNLPNGLFEGNGIRWTFNDNVLPFFGVGTRMTGSFDDVVRNLQNGNPSIALLNDRDEVIIYGVDSHYFYVVHGNKRKNNSFEEQIPIAEFMDSVKALWLCFSAN